MAKQLREVEKEAQVRHVAMESKLRQPGWARRAREGRVTSLPPIRSLSPAVCHSVADSQGLRRDVDLLDVLIVEALPVFPSHQGLTLEFRGRGQALSEFALGLDVSCVRRGPATEKRAARTRLPIHVLRFAVLCLKRIELGGCSVL